MFVRVTELFIYKLTSSQITWRGWKTGLRVSISLINLKAKGRQISACCFLVCMFVRACIVLSSINPLPLSVELVPQVMGEGWM